MFENLSDLLSDQNQYEMFFNQFEYLFLLLYVDYTYEEITEESNIHGPIGRFGHKYITHGTIRDKDFFDDLDKKVERESNILEAGAFSGSFERYQKVKNSVLKTLKNTRMAWGHL